MADIDITGRSSGDRMTGLEARIRPGSLDVRGQQTELFPFDAWEYDRENREITVKSQWTLIAGGMVAAEKIIVGYYSSTGGTYEDPHEGDRYTYIDGDEIGMLEYTAEEWSTVKGIKIGGMLAGLFLSMISCQMWINPLRPPEVLSETIPTGLARVVHFENNTNDQHGNGADTENFIVYSTAWKKFGVYSMFSSASTSTAEWNEEIDFTKAMGLGSWVYVNGTLQSVHCLCKFQHYGDVNNYITLSLWFDSSTYAGTNEVVLHASLFEKTGGVDTTYKIESNKLPLSLFDGGHEMYVSISWEPTDGVLSLTYNDTKYSQSGISVTQFGTYVPVNTYFHLSAKNFPDFLFYKDEACFIISEDVDSDLFIQHYNHNIPWNTDYSAKDLIAKPADGGEFVVDGPLRINDGYDDGSGGTWHLVTDPATGFFANKTSGWTADSFSGGLEVDFSTLVPAGTKAVRITTRHATAGGLVYSRKSGDTNISNTPNASQEYSHILFDSARQPEHRGSFDIWLSSDYKAQFSVSNVNMDLYISYPIAYMV